MITNTSNVPLLLAVWAVNDKYDYVVDPTYFSVTSLLKPVRQIILQKRVDASSLSPDVKDFAARAMGTSIHDSIELAWDQNAKKNLMALGVKENVADKFKINPESVSEGDIPIYMEQRAIKEFSGYKIGGKFDFVMDGVLHDIKSTTTMKWTKGSSDEDYKLQGSLYKWLNPDKVESDYIRICFVFTDWSKLSAMKDPSYPQDRFAYRDIPLLTKEQTESWLSNKLDLITKYKDAPEDQLPLCSDEELWREPTKYKYFANPAATRATKNFDSWGEAYKYKVVEKKNVGIIKIVPGKPRRCDYCSAASICSQCKQMLGDQNGS